MIKDAKSDLSEVKEIVKKSAQAVDKLGLKLDTVSRQVTQNSKVLEILSNKISTNTEMIASNAEGINALLSGIKILQTDLTHLIDEHQFSTQEQIAN